MKRCSIKWLVRMACPSAPAGEVCLQASGCSDAGWYDCGSAAACREEEEGSALRLNLVQIQNPCARVTASQGATARRQDIPAQDEETSVTTCYANP